MNDWRQWIITLIAGGWLGSLTWIFNRQVRRIDNTASKDDLSQAIKRLDEHLADDKAIHSLMYAELKSVSVSLARLEGAVSGLPQKNT